MEKDVVSDNAATPAAIDEGNAAADEDNAAADEDNAAADEDSAVAPAAADENNAAAPATADADNSITPASTYEEALALCDQAFNDRDMAYLRASYLEPAGQEYIDYLLHHGTMTEEQYWEDFYEMQGDYYGIGTFESYTSEITEAVKLEDLKAVEEEIQEKYGCQYTVQEAYEITYNRIAKGTEGTEVNEGYRKQVVQVDGFWYIAKDL